MKRYAMGFFQGAPAMFEQPDGEYVKWSDLKKNPPIPTNPTPLDQTPPPYQDLSGCEVMVDREGVSLESGKPFGFTCCDCGLTHRCVIVSDDGKPVGFAIERVATGVRVDAPPCVECDATTVIHADGTRRTFCSSDQMMRAIADGTAGAEVRAARQPAAWRDAHDHATLYYEHPGEGYEVEPLYLAPGVAIPLEDAQR